MSRVVLRCPTCGTTQAGPGECEACFEGTVRYFCDNHAPGLWLDGPACKVCGATVGKAAPEAAKPTRPAGATVPLHRTRRPGPVGADAPGRRERAPAGPRRPPPREPEIEDAPAAPSLSDLLTHLATRRERPPIVVDESPELEPERPARAPVFGGCLLRVLLLVLLAIVLGVAGLLTLLGGLFQ